MESSLLFSLLILIGWIFLNSSISIEMKMTEGIARFGRLESFIETRCPDCRMTDWFAVFPNKFCEKRIRIKSYIQNLTFPRLDLSLKMPGTVFVFWLLQGRVLHKGGMDDRGPPMYPSQGIIYKLFRDQIWVNISCKNNKEEATMIKITF